MFKLGHRADPAIPCTCVCGGPDSLLLVKALLSTTNLVRVMLD